MRLSFGSYRVLNCLRIVWVLTIAWYELGIFHYAADNCEWPLASTATRVLIVADPQILDHRSYPDRSAFVTWLSRVFTDLNLRKSWYAVAKKHPDVVVFLGDMMDNGRYAMGENEYETYYQRFKSIFHLKSTTPVYYTPGNHDTGLGSYSDFSTDASERYVRHFGPLNNVATIAGYKFVFIDAPTLAEEDIQRRESGLDYEQWTPKAGGPVEFVKVLAKEPHTQSQPTILFSHIPLARPQGTSCGPLRERGTIHRGVGHGYQNTLGSQASDFLLHGLRPVIVFSGDDHDYCEYTHTRILDGRPSEIKEVTIKSFSIAMGIQQPGYQLLSLAPSSPPTVGATFADKSCLLPNQIDIYLSIYLPLIVFSLVVLALAKVVRGRSSTSPASSSFPMEDLQSSSSSSSSYALSKYLPSRLRSEPSTLPRPVLSTLRQRMRQRNSFLRDLRDVAIFPITLFVLITWWAFLDKSEDGLVR